MCIRDRGDARVGADRLRDERALGAEQAEERDFVDPRFIGCLLYTSDAADERSSVDLGGRRIIQKNTIAH